MRILLYPETVEGTIGNFDDTDVQTCLLIKTSAEDLQKVDLIFKLCELMHNPIVCIDKITGSIPLIQAMVRNVAGKVDKDDMFMRIDRDALLSCVNDERLTAADKVEYLKDDIRQMIRTANIVFETHPDLIPTLDDVFLGEYVSIMANLATALEVVLNEGIPLMPRFDTIESGDGYSVDDFDEIIARLKSYKDE
jgi:hypothetical protein